MGLPKLFYKFLYLCSTCSRGALSVASAIAEIRAEIIPNGGELHVPDLDNTSVGREITETLRCVHAVSMALTNGPCRYIMSGLNFSDRS